MIILTLEQQDRHAAEFDARHSAPARWDIGQTLLDFDLPSELLWRVDRITARLRSVFTVCRATYGYDVETSYNITMNAFVFCLEYGDEPEVTSLKHYRRGTGDDMGL